MNWISPDKGLEVYLPNEFEPKTIEKLACFDLDGTLIKTKSGLGRPKNRDDWQWFGPNIITKLRHLAENEGYYIVICTNQSQFSEHIKEKIEIICELLGIPILVMVSTGYTKYRKPMIGFWDYLINLFPMVKKDNCFYVGDSISEEDYSKCDLLWAYNVGIKFYYSYHFFENLDDVLKNRIVPIPKIPDFTIKNNENCIQLTSISNYDIVVLIGPPAIGKSTFAKQLVNEYAYQCISLDDFETKGKFNKKLLEFLEMGFKIVIDNNNYALKSRNELLDNIVENRPNANILALKINPSSNQREIAEYLNFHRCYTQGKWIPAVVYNTYYKKYIAPTLKEGFNRIANYFIEYTGLDKYY